ncbi:hypothetical protein JYU34_006158 [Plutella xylostella]|uniref:chitin synthase n=1 Tax=Plutella xylostella TaxID=51655 RepID=A0ABQ7QV20_PLUXY|nr:hypothetical protein JYU34_006158 [Plutella xylostella]
MAQSRGVKGLKDDSDGSDSDYDGFYDDPDAEDLDQRAAQETKAWNLFRELPVKKESGSMASTVWIDASVKGLKLLAYVFVFIFVLGSAVLSKGTLLFITSQLKKGRVIPYCNVQLALDKQFETVLPFEERLAWLWAALIVFGFPEVLTLFRSARICFFKTSVKPSIMEFMFSFIIASLETVGYAMLVLTILPALDVVKGAMLMNAMCFVPGLLNLVSRDYTDSTYQLKIVLDVLAVSAQVTAFVVWPLTTENSGELWFIPVACVFISLGWWENYINYVDKKSSMFLIMLHNLRGNLKKSRYYTERALSVWRIFLFMSCIVFTLYIQGDDPLAFFTKVPEIFDDRNLSVQEVLIQITDALQSEVSYEPTGEPKVLPIWWQAPLWAALTQVLSGYLCFYMGKFACKILIQNFSFTFALSLVGPLTVNLLIVFAGLKNNDTCAFHDGIPDYLTFAIPPVYYVWNYITNEKVWIWLLWLVSQAWVTFHTWQPRCKRLAAMDNLFRKPWYNGILIDQSLLLNRTKDDDDPISDEYPNENQSRESIDAADVKPSDKVTRIYICATMWHETKDEMIEFLKSIMRMDEDQCAHRVARKYLNIINDDYYELETHIFMDDAFEVSDHSAEDSQVNRFVKCLVETIDEAASEVHYTHVRLRPPKKYPTPYGGRLVWTLPGKTKMICHLKDKSKIRHRKRWSQVMYMYYFLGHRLMDLPISVERKEVISEHTYLLALDGDIDFKPLAVHILVHLMDANKNLGAACGRIHPVGSGFMAWYQKFEYAIGHWLQKSTEHMIGCVLCSPGCFSLFRGKALMDDNVMKKYTLTSHEARHYVQYDQGEDRWLCTLLLQRGYRVEYSAASDAFTHCPEHFGEFFNQRRRWVPSTMANILDLLADSKRTVQVNDNISTLYIIYQMTLMLGTVLGPGTIFLMLTGALNAIFGISNINALMWNLVPVTVFLIVCMTCKSEVQLFLANLITCFYTMMMMVVMVGIVLQIMEDGWLAPSSMFTVATFSIFFITAALHPQEVGCLAYLLIYYITIPSMYMLLTIYSLCNLNNVSWGTREVAQKKTAKEMAQDLKDAEEAKKKMEAQGLAKWLGKTEEDSGSIEFGVAGLCRLMCCMNPNDHRNDMHLMQISNTLEKMQKQLENLGADSPAEPPSAPMRRRSSMGLRGEPLAMVPEYAESDDTSEMPREERDDLINPYWIEDPELEKGEVDFLPTAETEFWKDLIDTYLRPIDEDKKELERISTDLKSLRDLMVFAFLMLNILFVLTVFMLQLNQDKLHFKWPIGQKVDIQYEKETNYIIIDQDFLQLEPIGTLFIVFFGSVMLIQFTAMVVHRWGTLTHLLSTVNLNWYCTKRVEEFSNQANIENNGIEIARDLQKLNDEDLTPASNNVGRRKTVQNLLNKRDTKSAPINLDANFKRRLTMVMQDPDQATVINRMPSLGSSEVARRATLRALQNRRESVKPGSLRASAMFNNAAQLGELPRRPSGVAYINKAYEPALDSDEESPAPRRSTVRFTETFT